MASRAPVRPENGKLTLNNLATGVVGFFVEFNLVPTAWHIPVTRITLLLMLPCIAYLVHRVINRRNPGAVATYCLAIAVFITLHVAFTNMSLSFGSSNTDLALTIGFVLYFIGGIGLYILLTRAGGVTTFCWGLVLGALCSLPVLLMEAHGFKALAITLGLAEQHQAIQQLNMPGLSERLSGMWGHANEVGHVLAIATPAAGYLYISNKSRIPLIMVLFISLVGYFYTVNRGGVIASMVTFIIILLASERGERREKEVMRNILFVTIGFIGIIAALYLVPTPEFLWKHLTDERAASQNAAGRITTTLASLQIALQSPFGMLISDWHGALMKMTGLNATHNGFLSLGLELGTLMLPMLFFALATVIVYGVRKPRMLSLDIYLMLASIQLSVSFMFEELSDCDAFMLIMALIMARVYSKAVNLNDRSRNRVSVARRRSAPVLPAIPQQADNRL